MQASLHYSLEIAQGLGNIKFGFSTEDVQQYLGSPDETETLDPGTESTVMWYYASHQLQIIFQKSDCGSSDVSVEAKRITQLATSHPATTLWGTRIIGRTENEVLQLFKERGYVGFVECDEPLGYKSFRMDGLRVTLGFRHGILERVLLGEPEI